MCQESWSHREQLYHLHNQTRAEYYRQLDRSHRSGGDVLPFIEYALQGFVDGLEEQIETIKAQQLAVHWINHVHAQFRDRDTPADLRRRRLALDLSESRDEIPISRVRHISPRLAEAYVGKTERTLSRDLDYLEELGLVERAHQGVRARLEAIEAFLPSVRRDS